MSLYETRLLPSLIDWSMRHPAFEEVRARVVSRARGRTLELGFGTGLNARHYAAETDLVGVEPNPGMFVLAQDRLAKAGRTARLVEGAAEALPFEDGSFDAVVSTFTLCSVADPARVLNEAARVLRPGGAFHFAEHGLSDRPGVQRWQRRLTPAWRWFSGGCSLDRDVAASLGEAGFAVELLAANPMPSGAALAGLLREGCARRA